jgi:hypothetical protein
VSTTAGFLTGRRVSSSAPPSGPAAHAGTAYTTALEQSNDHATAGWLRGGAGWAGGSAGSAAMVGGPAVGGVVAAAGAAATAAAAVLDHLESQVSSAAADAGLGHASSPRGHSGSTRGRFTRRSGGSPAAAGSPVGGANGHVVEPAYAPDTAAQETTETPVPPPAAPFGQEGPRA